MCSWSKAVLIVGQTFGCSVYIGMINVAQSLTSTQFNIENNVKC